VIDNQDQIERGQGSGFHWENPSARKVLATTTGIICAELVKEFLEFYKLDYSLAIFTPEVNLSSQTALSKEELMNKIGLDDAQMQKPLLMQVVEGFISGEKSTSAFKQRVDSMLNEPQKVDKIQPQKKEQNSLDQAKPSVEENKA